MTNRNGVKLHLTAGLAAAGCVAVVLLASCGAGGDGPAAVPTTMPASVPALGASNVKVTTVTHRGIENCFELSAGQTKVVVVPAWAGRISLLDFGAGNVLAVDPAVDGKVLKAADGWAPWDGNATDIVATQKIDNNDRQWKSLWLHPYPKVKATPTGVEMTSEVNPTTNLSVTKSYALAGDGKSLSYDCTITSHGGEARGWTVWERALVPIGGYTIAPLAKGGAYPQGWKTRDNTTVDPADRVQMAGDFVVMAPARPRGRAWRPS